MEEAQKKEELSPEQEEYLEDKNNVLKSLAAARKALADASDLLKKERKDALLEEMEKLEQVLNACNTRADLPEDLYAGLGAAINSAFERMDPRKIVQTNYSAGKFESFTNDPLFIGFARLTRNIEMLHRNDDAARNCNELFIFKFKGAFRAAREAYHPRSQDKNAKKVSEGLMDMIFQDMRAYLTRTPDSAKIIEETEGELEKMLRGKKKQEPDPDEDEEYYDQDGEYYEPNFDQEEPESVRKEPDSDQKKPAVQEAHQEGAPKNEDRQEEQDPDQQSFLHDKNSFLDSLKEIRKDVENAPGLKEERRKALLYEMEKLELTLNACNARASLPDNLYAGLGARIQDTLSRMDPAKIKHIDEAPGEQGNIYTDNLFLDFALLGKAMDELHPNDKAAKDCNQLLGVITMDALRLQSKGISAHPFDERSNEDRIRIMQNFRDNMKLCFIMTPDMVEKREEAKAIQQSSEKHFERLKQPDRSSYGKVYLSGMRLEKKDSDALSGTGSKEYTRLANAVKTFRDAPTANVKELYEAARDYLKLKKTTPVSPSGKARVEAAAKIMAQAAVKLMEGGYFGKNDLAKKEAYFETMAGDLKVECIRNSTFRRIMANECPRLIEGGETQMYSVMHLAVSCEQECKGANAVIEGPAATACVINGVFTVQNNANYASAKELADHVDAILAKKGLGELEATGEHTRRAVDNLSAAMKETLAPARKPAAPKPGKQTSGPQMGGMS